jgi:hypothetical protein
MLRLPEWVAGVFRPKGVAYPVRRVDGTRSSQQVRWICHRCISRANRISVAHDLASDLDEQVDRRKLLGP